MPSLRKYSSLAAINRNTTRTEAMNEFKTEYYFSKPGIILSFIFIFIVLFTLTFSAYFLSLAENKIPLFICLIILILFLTTFPSFYIRVKYFLKKKPALILTKDEFIDNINFQKFKWTDFKNITLSSVTITPYQVNYIALSLINPQKHIKSITNPYKRYTAKISEKYFQGAFSIQPNIIKCDNRELLETLINYYKMAN